MGTYMDTLGLLQAGAHANARLENVPEEQPIIDGA